VLAGMVKFRLIDIKPRLSFFTWSNRRIGASFVAEWLDRFLVSSDIISLQEGCESKTLMNSL